MTRSQVCWFSADKVLGLVFQPNYELKHVLTWIWIGSTAVADVQESEFKKPGFVVFRIKFHSNAKSWCGVVCQS